MKEVKDGYTLSKQWFDFVNETDKLVKTSHGSLYFWLIQLNNQLKWKHVFGLPSNHSMNMTGIKSYKVYRKTLDDLIKWGFVELRRKSSNQYTANEIALVLIAKADSTQIEKHGVKQSQSRSDINKQDKLIIQEKLLKPGKVFPYDEEEEKKRYYDKA
jgi:hypothetical protein